MSISIKELDFRNKFSIDKNKNSKTSNTSRGQNLNSSSRNSEFGKLKIRNNISDENVDKLDTISSSNAWQQLKLFQRALNNQNIEAVHGKKSQQYLNFRPFKNDYSVIDLSEKNSEQPVPSIIPPYRPPPPYRAKGSFHFSPF